MTPFVHITKYSTRIIMTPAFITARLTLQTTLCPTVEDETKTEKSQISQQIIEQF